MKKDQAWDYLGKVQNHLAKYDIKHKREASTDPCPGHKIKGICGRSSAVLVVTAPSRIPGRTPNFDWDPPALDESV